MTNMQFTVHVYLANQVVRVQTQMIVTSLINLLCEYIALFHNSDRNLYLFLLYAANFGGVFNLCLGISIISIVELMFYCCFRIPQKSAAKNEKKSNVVSVKAMNNQLQIFK